MRLGVGLARADPRRLAFDNPRLGDTITLSSVEHGKSIAPGELQHGRARDDTVDPDDALETKASPV